MNIVFFESSSLSSVDIQDACVVLCTTTARLAFGVANERRIRRFATYYVLREWCSDVAAAAACCLLLAGGGADAAADVWATYLLE